MCRKIAKKPRVIGMTVLFSLLPTVRHTAMWPRSGETRRGERRSGAKDQWASDGSVPVNLLAAASRSAGTAA